jgi:hypothetical protein
MTSTNPILTTKTAVTAEEIAVSKTLNGTDDIRRFDVRIDSAGNIFSRIVTGESRDGTITYSDDSAPGIMAELAAGNVSDYYRNYFGALVRD